MKEENNNYILDPDGPWVFHEEDLILHAGEYWVCLLCNFQYALFCKTDQRRFCIEFMDNMIVSNDHSCTLEYQKIIR